MRRCLWLGYLLLAAAGCGAEGSVAPSGAGLESALGVLEGPLLGGTTDRANTAVLAIVSATRSRLGLCTGTLVAPNLVLTARHCVSEVPGGLVDCEETRFAPLDANQEVWVTSSTTLQQSSTYYSVSEVHVPSSDRTVCGNDIALLMLARVIASSQIEPMALRLASDVDTGDAYTAIGFGEADGAGTAGVRRVRTGLEVVCGSNRCDAPGMVTENEFVGEESVCEGDSGGPAVDVSGRVMGIASRGADDCGLAVYSAVAPWRSWIVEVAERAARRGEYDLPSWVYDAEGRGDAEAATAGVGLPGSERTGSESGEIVPLAPQSRPESRGCALRPSGRQAMAPAGAASFGLCRALLPLALGLAWFARRRRAAMPSGVARP